MSIVFQTVGILTTVQDLGRTGFRRFGINPNGAMDRAAARLVNILLGNTEAESVLEMHFPAPKILFKEAAKIALGGADFAAQINGKEIENWRPIFVESRSVLSFARKIFGNRCYLAVAGGFEIESWLGSASTNLKAGIGGWRGAKLSKSDELFFKENSSGETQKANVRISKSLIPPYGFLPTVRVTTGVEFENLNARSRKIFETRNFKIRHESDRMGFRLAGENLRLKKPLELISSAVNFGTIQLLPDGQLIILMADYQTTGGYPRVANIISRDLPLVAQLGAGDQLNFKIVSLAKAEKLLLELEKDLNLLKTACRFLC
ncbi:MAG: biotin-dependent carboxyltransferase family protein [Pyrinomonadaceae bacterium]